MLSVICGILYRCGGTDQWKWCFLNQKLWRTLMMGLFVGSVCALIQWSWIPLICYGLYFMPSAFPYGEKSWLNFLGTDGKRYVSGFMFGLATAPVLLWWSLIQAMLSGVAFVIIRKLDDEGKIHNPWVEFFSGLFGTILLEAVWLMALLKLLQKT